MEALLKWYRKHKRSFPWRDSGNPFDVWISEIMLQQTRSEAVIPYFNRFRQQIPDIRTLSEIDEDALLRLWEGLGYYSRARNLRKCARILMREHHGQLPADQKTLLSLPGIGPYTSGAILSIGFGLPYPAVDGNVLRVLSRYFAITEDIRSIKVRKSLEESISAYYAGQKITDSSHIRDLSQAFMDLGAGICSPNGKPSCEKCPLNRSCLAFKEGMQEQIPYRSPDKERRIVCRTLLVIRNYDRFLLRKREEKGLLAGMYEFIGVERKMETPELINYVRKLGYDLLRIQKLPSSRHVFSHLEWQMDAYELTIADDPLPLKEREILTDREGLQKLGIPSAFKIYLDYYALRRNEK